MAPRSETTLALFAALLSACGQAAPERAVVDEDEPDEAEVDTPVNVANRPPDLFALRYDERPPPEDPSNRVADDPLAVRFGQRLFFDTSLSGPLIEGDNDGTGGTLGVAGEAGKVSCASCHVPESSFVDTRSPHQQISLAAQWTERRTPTLLDVSFASLYNWDGRRDSIWGQAAGVFESDREFNGSRLFIAHQIARNHADEYEAIFGALPDLSDEARFPRLAATEQGCEEITRATGAEYVCRGKPGDGAEYDGMTVRDQEAVTLVMVNAAKAMAAYVRALRCGPGAFDRWLDGDDAAMDDAALRGAELFVGKAGCAECHSGPYLSDGQFHNVGLQPAVVAVAFVDRDDRGAAEAFPALSDDPLNTRGEFSDGERAVQIDARGAALEGAFRTPTLRCIADQPSFMHTGQFKKLASVIDFFADGGHPHGYPGTSELEPLDLDESEREDLLAFLGALVGDGPAPELLRAP